MNSSLPTFIFKYKENILFVLRTLSIEIHSFIIEFFVADAWVSYDYEFQFDSISSIFIILQKTQEWSDSECVYVTDGDWERDDKVRM